VAGLLFAFAIVVMPGIRSLSDKEFIKTFQVIDKVIQNNQPLFMMVWIGSILATIGSLILGLQQLDGIELLIIIIAAILYLFGVQLSTAINNIPLNNKLQTIDVDIINDLDAKLARESFESRWNQWNIIRSVFASIVSILLIVLLLLI
jgi:uncharacterized membrane protein